MSIKGGFKELYVGKKESNLMGLFNKEKIDYSDLSSIDYCLSQFGISSGYLNFNKRNGKIIRFEFGTRANDKIEKMVELVENNNPDLEIKEHYTRDFKFYQTDWFMILMSFCCCFPVGLFLMWFYKKFNKIARIIITFFLVSIWCYNIYVSCNTYKTAMDKMNNAFNQIYGKSNIDKQEKASMVNDKTVADTEAFSTTLTAGHYVVGTDIPVGTYNFFSKRGSGNLYSSDGNINVIFDYNSESAQSIGIDDFGTDELKNVFLTDGIILSVTGSQEISAGCSDGQVNAMKERNPANTDEIKVGYGHYGVPDNIPAGTYNVELMEGNGNIICSSSSDTGINEIMGESKSGDKAEESMYIKKFKNLILEDSDILEIDNIKIKLTPSN